jgi:hypothetical protein
MAVADLIAEQKLDVPSVVGALLHDTVEDTLLTLEEIKACSAVKLPLWSWMGVKLSPQF